jgi:hypothetical protein
LWSKEPLIDSFNGKPQATVAVFADACGLPLNFLFA